MRSRRAASANTRRQSAGGMPLRPSPVSSLRCTPTGRSADAAAAACWSWSKLEMPSSTPSAAASEKSAPGACSHASERRDDPRAAERQRLADVGDAEPGGTALERGDRRAHRAVAVPSALTTAITSEPVRRRRWRTLRRWPRCRWWPRADARGEAAHARCPPAGLGPGLGDD